MLRITKADVGRRVRLRNGQTGKIVGWLDGRNHPVEYRLSKSALPRWTTDRGLFRLDEKTSGLDIVELLDFKEPALKITEDDVGRRVRLRNGQTGKIVKWDCHDVTYPVRCETSRSFVWVTTAGRFYATGPESRIDIVELLDREPPALKITEDDVGRRVRLRDGRIGKIVSWNAHDKMYPAAYAMPNAPSLRFVSAGGRWSPDMRANDLDAVELLDLDRFRLDEETSGLDIVELLDREPPALKITEDDVGRRVRLRDGRIGKIVKWDCHHVTYPVGCELPLSFWWAAENGQFFAGVSKPHDRDIVGWLDLVDAGEIAINGTRYKVTLEKIDD